MSKLIEKMDAVAERWACKLYPWRWYFILGELSMSIGFVVLLVYLIVR